MLQNFCTNYGRIRSNSFTIKILIKKTGNSEIDPYMTGIQSHLSKMIIKNSENIFVNKILESFKNNKDHLNFFAVYIFFFSSRLFSDNY